MQLPDIIVTNFKRRTTGVSSTAINVTAAQQRLSEASLALCGPQHSLRLWQALVYGFSRPAGQRFRVWHVRRNSEMLWGLIAKHVLRQPVRLVFTSAAIRPHSAVPRWLIARMDGVIATSAKAASFLDRVDRIQGHGVDTAAFVPSEKTPHPSIVCVGRIRAEKGTHILMQAACQILPEFPEVKLHFIGQAQAKDQAFYEDLKQSAKRAGIDQQIVWHGELPPANVAATLAKAHILAATPLYEGYGLTPFEGMAAGCAILVSDTGAFADAVDEGRSGILVPIDDVPATAAALHRLLSDKTEREAMMGHGVSLVREKFSIDQEAVAALQVYAKVQN